MYNQNTTALMEQETFVLPAMAESEFSSAELAEDMDGLQMSFQRVKIPANTGRHHSSQPRHLRLLAGGKRVR